MSHLITASIVGSVDWLKHCPASWKERAAKDLKNQLARIWTDSNAAQQRGMAFEDAVCAATKEDAKGTEHFRAIVDECRGGEFQRVTKTFLTVDGQEYCLYGKIDVYFPMLLKDIKTTGNYKGAEHYTDTFQHVLYCYNERVPDFRYLVAEFDGETDKLVDHHFVDAHLDLASLEEEVVATIRSFVGFIIAHRELFELYTTTFSRK